MAGAISEAIEPVLEHARTVMPQIATAPFPELVASGLGRDVVVRGAIEHALARLRADPLSLLGPGPEGSSTIVVAGMRKVVRDQNPSRKGHV